MLVSLTSAQKAIIVLSLVALIAGFWYGAGGTGRGGADAPEDVTWEAPVATDAPIVVHVTGAVQRPGLYRIPAGSRVHQAIAAAGGFAPGACQDSVNLASFCEDGEQVTVPAEAAPPAAAAAASPEPEAASPPQTASVPAQSPPPTPARGHPQPAQSLALSRPELPPFAQEHPKPLVRINHAGLEELQALPGIGPELARRILYHRQVNGPFRSLSELDQVSGIGPATIEQLRTRVTVN